MSPRRSPQLARYLPLVLVTAFAVLAATLLAACGDEPPPSGEATRASGGFPVAIEHKYGNTRIGAPPKRVVTVGWSDQDPVLALGVKPVGVVEWYGDYPGATWPWAQKALGGAKPTIVGETDKLNFEKIVGLRPDVIIGLYSGMDEKTYRRLSKIAPTVAQSDKFADFGMPWQEITTTVGRVLGREQRAEELVGGIEARFAEAREQHPEFAGQSIGVGALGGPGKYFLYGPQDPKSQFMTELGFKIAPPVAKAAGKQGSEISNERVRLLDNDVLVWYADAEFEPKLTAALREDRLYPTLDVVKEKRVVFATDLAGQALSWSTVLSLPLPLDELMPRLAEAAKRS